MKNHKHWASWGLMLCLTLGAYSAQAQAPQNPTAATGKPSKPSLTVTVALPKTEMVTQSIPANGTLAAWQEAIIGAEANGLRTTEVRVNVGDWVQRGALLALLQSDTLKAELAQAQASLGEANAAAQEAHAQAERVRTLHQQGFYSAAQLSQALATGVVESTMTSGATGVDSKLYEHLKYYYDVQAWLPKNAVIANKKAFDALDKATQDAVLKAAADAEARGWTESRKVNDSTLATLKANGMTVTAPSAQLKADMKKVGDTMLKEWLEKSGAEGKALVDAYNK